MRVCVREMRKKKHNNQMVCKPTFILNQSLHCWSAIPTALACLHNHLNVYLEREMYIKTSSEHKQSDLTQTYTVSTNTNKYIHRHDCVLVPHTRVWTKGGMSNGMTTTMCMQCLHCSYNTPTMRILCYQLQIPYSLNFSKLKLIADFMDQSRATKCQVHNRNNVWLAACPRKFNLQKFVFHHNLAKL